MSVMDALLAAQTGSGPLGSDLIQIYNPTANSIGPQVLVDSSNNIYQGVSQGTSTSALVKLAKYNANGEVIWKKQITNLASLTSMCLDLSGNILLLLSTGNSVYILQYSTEGSLIKQKLISGILSVSASEIKVDSSGNICIVGRATPSGYTTSCGFVLKLSSNLNTVQWARFYGNTSATDVINNITGLNFDSSNNIYFVGIWGGTPPSGSGYRTAWMLGKYTANGTLALQSKYAAKTDDQRFESASHVALDSSGNIYVTGAVDNFVNSIRYGVAKFNSSGTIQWAKHFDSDAISSSQTNKGIILGADNYLYISRSVNYNISWAKINTSGALQFSRSLATIGTDDSTNLLYLDTSGSVYIAGRTNTTNPKQSIILKVPQNGTKTGTYGGYTYQADAPTFADSSLAQESLSQTSYDATLLISISDVSGTEQTNTDTISTILI